MFSGQPLIFVLTNNGKIKIDCEPLSRMLNYLQNAKEDTEAGGVILARFIKDCKDVVIDRVSVPMIGDKRSRFSFTRNKKMHQRIIDSEWEKSKGTCNYIGEWHTHPENYPTPSKVDISNWKNRLKDDLFPLFDHDSIGFKIPLGTSGQLKGICNPKIGCL